MGLDQRKVPILLALKDHLKKSYYSFHMPGHKFGAGIDQELISIIGSGLFKLDMTELPGLDDLHLPGGCIDEAQRLAAKAFGAGATFFLVNGSSSGIHAGLLAVSQAGGKVLVPRNAHRSVMAGLILSGIAPVWIANEFHPEFLVPLPISSALYQEKIKDIPKAEIRAFVTINPTYHGFCSDLEYIAEMAHREGIPVIADEAHGPHFHFHSGFPISAMKAGVDVAIQSTHKMLTAANQGAMMHIGSKSIVPPKKVFRQLTILQTTSPSYPILATLDSSRKQMAVDGYRLLDEGLERVRGLIVRIKKISGLRVAKTDDPFKILISVGELGITGYTAAEYLRKEFKIQVELADLNNILLLCSFGNSRKSMEHLIRALEALVKDGCKKKGISGCSKFHDRGVISKEVIYEIKEMLKSYPIPNCRLTPREAWFSQKKLISIEEALGHISAEIVAPYPPGIPLLGPGEEITTEVLEHLRMIKALSIPVQGCENPALEHINVVVTS